jgi:signal transduction histidine kinase
MAATIAHEINNPLESVFNLVYLVRQNQTLPPDVRDYLRTTEIELGRISHVVKQTLGYYRESNVVAPLQVNSLLDEVLGYYQSRIDQSHVRVHRNFAAGLPLISLNRGEMMQVISNLITNALYAMPDGGGLTVTTRPATYYHSQGLEFLIADDGVGIKPQDLLRIFEPFYTTRANMGIGIGLWVVRQIIDARGGHISVLSSVAPQDHGTTFTIFLPFAVAATTSKSLPFSQTDAPK